MGNLKNLLDFLSPKGGLWVINWFIIFSHGTPGTASIRAPQASGAPTNLRTSNHSQESLLREDVLRWIFRPLWPKCGAQTEATPSCSMKEYKKYTK